MNTEINPEDLRYFVSRVQQFILAAHLVDHILFSDSEIPNCPPERICLHVTLDVYADLFDEDLEAVSTALNKARSAAIVAIPLPPAGLQVNSIAQLPRKVGGADA